MERKVKYQSLEILVLYLHHDGTNTEFVVDQLKIVSFEIYDNVELHSVFNLIKLLGQQKEVNKDVASWITLEIQEICLIHHQNPYVSNCIVEIIPDVLKLSRRDEDLFKDIIMMVMSFTKKCVQKHYSPDFSVALLHQLKSFHKVKLFVKTLNINSHIILFNRLSSIWLTTSAIK